jgi:hypothetical protein
MEATCQSGFADELENTSYLSLYWRGGLGFVRKLDLL